MKILKYQLSATPGVVSVDMPKGAKVLHIREQPTNGGIFPHIWAEVDAAQGSETRKFRTVWTGRDESTIAQEKYIGTAHCGGLVCHVYEVTH